MKRLVGTATVAFVALLVLTAQPATAATVTVSEHTTFGTGSSGETSPASLTNAQISGSGASASVAAQFEPTRTYNPVDDEGDGSNDGFGESFVGDDVSDSPVGSEVRVQPSFSGKIHQATFNITNVQNGQFYSPTVEVYVVQETPDGTFGEGTSVATFTPSWSTGTQTVQFDSAYDISAGQNYTIEFVTQSSNNDGEVDRLYIGTDDSASTVWMNSVNKYADLEILDEQRTSAQYVGAPHSASDLATGEADLSLTDASATVKWQEDGDNDGTWTTVATTTYSTSGTKSDDLSGISADRWRAVVEFSTSSPSTATAELDAERVLSENDAPTGSNPSPTPNQLVTSYDGTVDLDVADPDFPTAQGEEVTVEVADSGGSQIGSETITSNQTVSISYPVPAGSNNLTWTLTDSAGQTTTVEHNFSAPSALEIRNESAPSQLVSLPSSDVEIRFYFDVGGDPLIVNRTPSNGRVDMTGLPTDRPFTVVVDDETDKYVNRRIFVEDLFARQTVYLLPENKTSAPVVFDVADYSGSFDQSESALLVQRALNGTWETVEGDIIGASERISTRLRVDARHRILIVNARTGERRVLGPFTPVAAGEQQISVTSENAVVVGSGDGRATLGPDIGQLAARPTTISSSVQAQDGIANATLTVTASWPNGTTTTLATTSRTDAGDLSTQVDLTNLENATVSAQTVYNTSSGTAGSVGRTWTIRPTSTTEFSLLSVLGEVPTLLPASSVGAFTLALGLLVTLLTSTAAAATFRLSTETVAVIAMLQLGAFGAIGWVPWTIPFAAAIGAAGLAAIRRGI